MTLLLLPTWGSAPWGRVFNTKTTAATIAAPGIVLGLSLCFIVNLPLTVVQRAQLAIQQGYESNLWQCVGALLGMASVFLGVALKLGPSLEHIIKIHAV